MYPVLQTVSETTAQGPQWWEVLLILTAAAVSIIIGTALGIATRHAIERGKEHEEFGKRVKQKRLKKGYTRPSVTAFIPAELKLDKNNQVKIETFDSDAVTEGLKGWTGPNDPTFNPHWRYAYESYKSEDAAKSPSRYPRIYEVVLTCQTTGDYREYKKGYRHESHIVTKIEPIKCKAQLRCARKVIGYESNNYDTSLEPVCSKHYERDDEYTFWSHQEVFDNLAKQTPAKTLGVSVQP